MSNPGVRVRGLSLSLSLCVLSSCIAKTQWSVTPLPELFVLQQLPATLSQCVSVFHGALWAALRGLWLSQQAVNHPLCPHMESNGTTHHQGQTDTQTDRPRVEFTKGKEKEASDKYLFHKRTHPRGMTDTWETQGPTQQHNKNRVREAVLLRTHNIMISLLKTGAP